MPCHATQLALADVLSDVDFTREFLSASSAALRSAWVAVKQCLQDEGIQFFEPSAGVFVSGARRCHSRFTPSSRRDFLLQVCRLVFFPCGAYLGSRAAAVREVIRPRSRADYSRERLAFRSAGLVSHLFCNVRPRRRVLRGVCWLCDARCPGAGTQWKMSSRVFAPSRMRSNSD